ncbi:uncharacterized protein ACRADG_004067 [Cochliomyia hominivorax]
MTRILCISFINLIVLLYSVISVQSSCRLSYSSDNTLRPNLYTFLGTRKIKINLSSNPNNNIQLQDQQEIVAQCDNYFEKPINDRNQLFIKCDKNLYLKTDAEAIYNVTSDLNSEIFLECSKLKWNLYESISTVTWCPTNVTSYLLARPKHSSLEFEHLAVVCYDTDNLSLKSVYYTLAPGYQKFKEPKLNSNVYKPGFELKNLKEIYGKNQIDENLNTEPELRNWLSTLNYDFNSIIQHSKLDSIFNEHYSFLLEFLWWPNLRLHNWRNYIKALESHVESDHQTYDILAGVSGVVEIPQLEECHGNFNMKQLNIDEHKNIPIYVWNYLQDREKRKDDIVIIGINSPFQEFYSKDDVIFCEDKCKEISWLKTISSSFRHSIMGIVFCCTVEDVQSSNRLSGFPGNRPADMKTLLFYNDNRHTSSNDASEEGEED